MFLRLPRILRGIPNNNALKTFGNLRFRSNHASVKPKLFVPFRTISTQEQKKIKDIAEEGIIEYDTLEVEVIRKNISDGVLDSAEESIKRLLNDRKPAPDLVYAQFFMKKAQEPGMSGDKFEKFIDTHVQSLREKMHRRKFRPGFYAAIVWGFTHLRDLSGLSKYYEIMLAHGFLPNTDIYNVMLKCCSQLQDSASALALMEDMKQYNVPRDVVTYSTAMNCCSQIEDKPLIEQIFDSMVEDGITPNIVTYTTMLAQMGNSMDENFAETVLLALEKLNVVPDLNFISVLISSSVRKRDFEKVQHYYSFFKKYQVPPDAVIYNFIIDACGRSRQFELAEKMWNDLEEWGVEKNVDVYSSIIVCNAEKGDSVRVKELFKEMLENGFKPTTRTVNALLRSSSNLQELKSTYRYLIESGLTPNEHTFRIMKVKCILFREFLFMEYELRSEAEKHGFNYDKTF